jgi:hypothetical protein
LYPFGLLEVGQTFDIPAGPGQPKMETMRSYCSKKGAELRKKFLVHQYPDGLIQVYRKS